MNEWKKERKKEKLQQLLEDYSIGMVGPLYFR